MLLLGAGTRFRSIGRPALESGFKMPFHGGRLFSAPDLGLQTSVVLLYGFNAITKYPGTLSLPS